MEFTDDGDMVTNLTVEQQSNASPSGSLVFEKDNAPQVSISTTSVGLKGSLAENLISDPIAGELALFDLTNSPVAVFSTILSKSLAVIGNNQGDFIPTSAVVYAGDAVFTDNSGEMTLSYKNVGSEGKVMYDQNLTPQEKYFYAKDHLGSTRMVVSGDAVVTSANEYKAYGEIVPLLITPDGDGKAREMFTGKEFDQEGGLTDALCDIDIMITGFILKDTYDDAVTITFSDNTTQTVGLYRNSDEEWASRKVTLTFSETKTITMIRIQTHGVNDSRGDINYTENVNWKLEPGKTTSISLNVDYSALLNTSDKKYIVAAVDKNPGMGLDYFGARYYDAVVGRWTSTDPVNQFWDGYDYTGGNPVNRTDPDGRFVPALLVVPVAVAILGAASSIALLMSKNKEGGGKKFDLNHLIKKDEKEAEENSAQDTKLTGKQIKELNKKIKKDGYDDIEDFKVPGGKGAGKLDLYKKPNGDVVIKPKGGNGPGEPTGYNINN